MRNIYFFHLLSLFILTLRLFYSLRSLTWLGCWLGIELGNLILYLWFNINYIYRNIVLRSLYYWVRGVRGFGILGCYFFYELYPLLTSLGFIFFFILKIGIFPFYGWVLIIFKHIDYTIFFILSRIIKLPLLVIADYFFYLKGRVIILILLLICFIRFFIGTRGMRQIRLKGVLGYSSINVAADFFISYYLSYDLFFFVFINYFFLLFGFFFIFSFYFGNINFFNLFTSKRMINNNKLVEIIFLALFGIPFFLSFYIKLIIGLYFFFQGFRIITLIMFFILIIIACLNYYRCWSFINYIFSIKSFLETVERRSFNIIHIRKGSYYYFFLSVILLGLYIIFRFFIFI